MRCRMDLLISSINYFKQIIIGASTMADYPKGGYNGHVNGENTGLHTYFARACHKLPNIHVGHDDLWLRSNGRRRSAERPKSCHLQIRIRLHFESHCSNLIGHEHTGAGLFVRANYWRRLLAPAAAKDDPLRRAPGR